MSHVNNCDLKLVNLCVKCGSVLDSSLLIRCLSGCFLFYFSARDAFVRTNRRAIAMMFVRLSV